ncbi:MAG: diguanylate cyclase [Alphaproteobacteria bacterium]|nr:MAG: diguanylate cyclase [Alphaproteobacteria bacterium]
MPMHLIVAPSGHVRQAGPTVTRILGAEPVLGRPFLELFELRRPRDVAAVGQLCLPGGTRLSLRLRPPARTPLKGLAVPLAGEEGGLFVNLAFGIGAIEAVARYRLTASDFAPTDPTVELLYLAEANRAVLTESRNLNRRLQGAMIAVEEQAFTDTLTGLKNRRAMEHILERLSEAGADFALMLVDLDFFKEVNDTHGHAAGDHVLQEVARRLISATRAKDAVARVGGDEFVLIFPGLTDLERLAGIARRIIDGLEQPIAFGPSLCRISASIGVASTAGHRRPDAEQMLKDADAALYASKRSGRARFTLAASPGGGPDGPGAARRDAAPGDEAAAPSPASGAL